MLHAHTGARQTCVHGKIIISIIINPKETGDASSTRIREPARHVYMAKYLFK